MGDDYSITVMSHRHHLGEQTRKSLLPLTSHIHDGTDIESFSKLVNECIVECDNEMVILCSEKARPTPENVDKMVEYLNQGYGFVALWGLGFFGFNKELIRRIGFFDERYIGGGCEDFDFLRRLKQADIAIVWTFEISFNVIRSSWNQDRGRIMDAKKWEMGTDGLPIKKLNELKYKYNLGASVDLTFLPYSHSILTTRKKNETLAYEFTHGTEIL